ncbi:hypothetical protein ACROYT_G019322 [Oculina patagonica]
MAEADQVPNAVGAEEITAQVNPPVLNNRVKFNQPLGLNRCYKRMRLETLENSQKAFVESALEELQSFIKMPMFSKEKALDYLINLKIVAKESKHPKSGFFNAVLQAMKDKIRVPDSQFQQYLQVLLGDKDHEKVLDSISKVDKAMRVAAPRPFAPRGRGRGGRASMVGRKRKSVVSNEGILEQASHWVEFRNQVKGIKPRINSNWVDINGVPDQKGVTEVVHWKDVLSGVAPELEAFKLRDPDHFSVGGLHRNVGAWDNVLEGHPLADRIGGWIRDKVDILQFARPFSGVFKRARSVQLWGEVGVDDPPYLVLPLTVEPSKPRLCIDARFLNLWMRDIPFSLDKLADVLRFIYRGSFMTKCDDKSGYNHVLLSENSQTYFGFSFGGLWLVCTTLPFGWKISPYIYHTIGLAASGFLRAKEIPCSLYIDDRLNGELLTSSGPWSQLPLNRSKEYRLLAARAALFVVLSILVELGYTIGIKKSVLTPTTALEYLGLVVDSEKLSFLKPVRKIESFAALREDILACKSWVALKTLQRFQGKCISFSLAVPMAKLFIREMSAAIARAPANGQSFRDYWNPDQRELFISSKKMLALVYAIKALPQEIRNARLDAYVDSQVMIGAWNAQGSKKSPQLTNVTKQLFFALSSRNIQLNLQYLPSRENQADAPSRRLSSLDVKLSVAAFAETLPRVPKLYTPSVACPVCGYPNDEHFKFCQQCGYVRRSVEDHAQSPAKKCKIDEGNIAERLRQLSQQRSSSRYVKQKSALEFELGQFLASLSTPKSLSSALPADIKAFLVWKDRGGRTKVHQSACPSVSQTGMSCACPKRLAFGTVDSLIGKLRAIFIEHGRGSEWHSLLGVGSPASCHSVKTYLADVREEQLRARITPRQAEPIILSDLRVISGYLEKMLLNSSVLSAVQVFIYARDQALFKALFFAGDSPRGCKPP